MIDTAWKLVKRTVSEFSEDDCMSSGAAIAYYTIFSLPPLLVIVLMTVTTIGIPAERIDEIVKEQLGIPTDSLVAAGSQSQDSQESSDGESEESSSQKKSKDGDQLLGLDKTQAAMDGPFASLGAFSRIIGIGILLFSATGVMAQLQFALNKAWSVEPDPEQGGVMNFLLKRLLSLGMVVVIAFLLLVSFVLTTFVDELMRMVEGVTPDGIAWVTTILLHNVVTLIVITFLFASMFKILPDAKMAWKDLWLGAAATAFLFVLGKTIISMYLQNSQVAGTWGSTAASMVLILVWVYYSSLIVLLGAEFTQSYAEIVGEGMQPVRGAVRTNQQTTYLRGTP
ncbi:YihY/virulence factor BrkB family protein [Thalassoroseus pseudoceratinae]|uniref:YihY/virulence factor BrkB family protein n=1 Tax=Thalassoroseus pseudoceratinae TaxID=2713176 RepID=UPI001422CA41|nr:YihY/virulence factor BrkB family protein [Thalassoroseus pseudoceratinae]